MVDTSTLLRHLKLIAPELALTGLILVIILADLFIKKRKDILAIIAFIGVLFAGGLALALKAHPMEALFQGSVYLDRYGIFFKVLFLAASAVLILFMRPVLAKWKSGHGEAYTLMIACTLGMMFMATANDLLMMYLALEFVSITSYIMAGLRQKDRKSAEASLKYIIYGAAASGMMIYGMSFLYGLTGTLQVDRIGVELMKLDPPLATTMSLVISVFIMAGFAYKIAAAPFHMWCPDVYEGAPTPVTAFFSIGPKAAGFAMLARFVAGVFQTGGRDASMPVTSTDAFQWNIVMAIVAVLTMAIGNFGALHQQNLKRLMAYSSIGHAGYMLLAFTAFSAGNMGWVMFYLVVYLIMNLGAFLVVLILEEVYGIETVDGCRGLGWKAPVLCGLMTLFLISLTGLPPTAGFAGKLLVFGGLIEYSQATGDGLPLVLVVIGVLFSVVSLFYYARIIGAMFLAKPREDDTPNPKTPIVWQGLLWFFAFATLWFGLAPSKLSAVVQKAVSEVFPKF